MLTAQAVNRATISILYIAGSKNRGRSMNETHIKSPKVCFSADSYLVYGKRRDSRMSLRPAHAPSFSPRHRVRVSRKPIQNQAATVPKSRGERSAERRQSVRAARAMRGGALFVSSSPACGEGREGRARLPALHGGSCRSERTPRLSPGRASRDQEGTGVTRAVDRA
jgi:hypothetical protein